MPELESLLGSTGVTIFDGDDEDDNVTNTQQNYRRVDVLALGDAIWAMGTPGIDLIGTQLSACRRILAAPAARLRRALRCAIRATPARGRSM